MIEQFENEPIVKQAVSGLAHADYLGAAFDAIDMGQPGIHPHKAFELATKHKIQRGPAVAACVIAKWQARDFREDMVYAEYGINKPAKDWLDEPE